MVTPELLEYLRAEVARGKTREEIHRVLISGGGWSEADLSEAFRTIIPMQDIVVPVPTLPVVEPVSPGTLAPALEPPVISAAGWQDLVFIIVGLLCVVSWYFYQPQIINFWNKGVESSQELSVNSWNSLEKFSINSWNSYSNFFKEVSFPALKLPSFSLPSFDFSKIFGTGKTQNNPVVAQNNTVVKNIANGVKDCGTGVTPKLDTPSTYENNPVLACLGAGALNCENVKGVLKDDFFPTVLEITKSSDSCNFKLSYRGDSALTDITGKKLAGQYISCPINIVKAIDNTNPSTPRFISPDKTDLSKYGSQIYFYGTLGLFVENNLNQNKIQSLGCEGEYIQSMIASYNLSEKK